MLRLFGLTTIAFFSVGWAIPAAEPAVEIRMQSLDGLLAHAEYLGNLVDQAEPAKQVAALVKAFTHPMKGLEGIDPTRPVGAYVIVAPNVVDSQVVGLLPIADSQAFLAMLRDKLRLKPQETDGLYELKIPNLPAPVFFRFQDGYLHATAIRSTGIDPKKLIKPATYFAQNQSSILSIQAHVDRVPQALKQTVFGQLELRVEEAKGHRQPSLSAAQLKLRNLGWDLFADVVKSWFDEGKQFRMDLMVKPQSDQLSLDVSVSARAGSHLSQALTGATVPSYAAALANQEKHPTFAGYLHVALPKRYQTSVNEIVDLIVEEAIHNARPEARAVARVALESLVPTLKSGVLSVGMAMTQPAKDRTIGLTTLMESPETRKVDKAIRELAQMIPPGIIAFDLSDPTEKGATIHTLNLRQAKGMRPIFGSQSTWLGTTQNLILVGFGKSSSALQAAAKLTPQSLAPTGLTFSVSQLVNAFEKQLQPEQVTTIIQHVFGEKLQPGADEVRLETKAGNPFQVRFTVQGKTIQFAVALDRARKATTAESSSEKP
ncbi:MAG: hypothetical protein LC104_20750 [Bacteroidales bacterium]|nr:hypothetical protein [Bacteroidales bacterium]